MRLEDINIKDVIDKMGLEYYRCGGGEFKIKGTDGRSFNVPKNMIKDFSKDRGEGNPFTFVSTHYGLDKNETIQWFKDRFNLDDKPKEIKKQIKEVKAEERSELNKIRKSLGQCDQEQKQYLKSRGIDYEKIKHIVKSNNGIACLVYDNQGIVGCKIRHITEEKNKRFSCIKGFTGDGVYLNGINKEKDYMIVVEGMFDFLTLRQFDTNVVGLSSWEQGIVVIKEISKKYKIIYINDIDESGYKSFERMKENIEFNHIDISQILEGTKDVNELFLQLNKPNDFISLFIDNNNQTKIEKIDRYDLRENIVFDHITKNPYTWGLDMLDRKFGKPEFKELCILVGYPSVGKTDFTFFTARENAKLGNKILYLSLELPKDDLFKRISRKKAGVSKYDYQQKAYTENQKKIMDDYLKELQNINNLKVIDLKDKGIEAIEEAIRYYQEDGYGMFFIDNLGKIDRKGKEESYFDEITSRLQNLKNEISKPIILLHHLNKDNGSGKPGGGNAFRGTQKIKDNCSVMLEIWRDLDLEISQEEKAQVKILSYKDTWDGIIGEEIVYFNKGEYRENFIQ